MARRDPSGCLAVAAILLIITALPILVRSVLAVFHHEAFYWLRVRLFIPTWFNPWQGIVLSGLVLGFAIWALARAIRDLRK
jgi:hypothetical protein